MSRIASLFLVAIAASPGCVLFTDISLDGRSCLADEDCIEGFLCVSGSCARAEECPVREPECTGPTTCATVLREGVEVSELSCGDDVLATCDLGCSGDERCVGSVSSLPGITFLPDTDVLGELRVPKGQVLAVLVDDAGARLVLDPDGDGVSIDPSCVNIEVTGGPNVAAVDERPLALIRAGSIVLEQDALLTVRSANASKSCGGLALVVDHDVTVSEGASIDLSGGLVDAGCGGFDGGDANLDGSAPEGVTRSSGGAGGSHATHGAGDDDPSGRGVAGAVFGAAEGFPLFGGGGGAGSADGPGGGGGGALYLYAGRAVNLFGTLDVRGGAGQGGGAGAGGTVVIEAGRLDTVEGSDLSRAGRILVAADKTTSVPNNTGAGRAIVRTANPGLLPRDVPLTDVGANPDNGRCSSIVEVVTTRTELEPRFDGGAPADLSFEAELLGEELLPEPLFVATSVDNADGRARLILSDGNVAMLFTDTSLTGSVAFLLALTPLDGVAIDAVTHRALVTGQDGSGNRYANVYDFDSDVLVNQVDIDDNAEDVSLVGDLVVWFIPQDRTIKYASRDGTDTGAYAVPGTEARAVSALAGRGSTLLVAFDGSDASERGIVTLSVSGTEFTPLAASAGLFDIDDFMGLPAPVTTLSFGGDDVAVAGFDSSGACFVGGGGAGILRRAEENLAFRMSDVPVWDARASAHAGEHVAMAGSRIAMTLDDAGTALLEDTGTSVRVIAVEATERGGPVGFLGNKVLKIGDTGLQSAENPR